MTPTQKSLEIINNDINICLNQILTVYKSLLELCKQEDLPITQRTYLCVKSDDINNSFNGLVEIKDAILLLAEKIRSQPYKSPVGSSTTVSPSGESRS